MFGAFSKLFKKSEPAPAPARSNGPQTKARSAGTLPKEETPGKAAVPKGRSAKPSGGDSIAIPYSAIIKLIPQELWGKLAPAGVAGYDYNIPRKTVAEQLPHGSVKVSFGELRRGAPAGVFVNSTAEDTRLVDLPLSEILSQLHPDSFARRSDQAAVEIPKDVPDLFGARGERLAPLRVMEKKEVSNTTSFARQNGPTPAAPKPAPAPAPPIPLAPPAPIKLTPRAAASASPAAPTAQPAAAPQKPAAPVVPPVPKAPAASPTTAARPIPKTAAPVPPRSAAPAAPAPIPPVTVPLPATQPEGSALFGSASFFIALDDIAENWPDGVRQELAQLKMPDAKVALPPVEICEGLKRGRIQYQWRTLRSWIQPTPFYATPSPHDEQMLELPLRTLTPLFLDFIRANPVNRQAADAENITEFFRKAEQASGTSVELLQPLFDTPTDQAPPPTPAPIPFTPQPNTVPLKAAAAPQPEAPQPAPPPQADAKAAGGAEPTVEDGRLCLPLSLIASGWPEPVVRDISQFNLGGCNVEIPLGIAEAGLKAGRVEFSWRDLCMMLNPPSKPAQVSINGENRVALPLQLIAPLFLKSRAGAGARKRTAVAENIPDLFSQIGKPLPPPPSAEEIQAPAAPVAAAPPEPPPVSPPAPKKTPTTLGELFGEPDKKSWTPNEIVQRTTQLPNVAGALIALQDGLLVAHHMPQGLKTETIAAFVPQIFGRLNQYTKDLQMGETTAVSFTVEVGTVQVYNAGIIYFAAVGKAGTLLPLAELQLIAGELSRHTK